MTREEAINELNDRIKSAEYVDSDYIDCVSVDAVKMAISALSVPETNVGDTISRQAAIDVIEKHIDMFDAIDANYLDGLKTAMSLLHKLPSAQQ